MTEESSNVDTLEGDRSRDAEGSKENPSDSAHAPVLGWGSKPTFANVRSSSLFLISTYVTAFDCEHPLHGDVLFSLSINTDVVCVVAVDDSRYRNCSSLHCRTILLQLIHMRLHTHTPPPHPPHTTCTLSLKPYVHLKNPKILSCTTSHMID